jgi:hypothetical protein
MGLWNLLFGKGSARSWKAPATSDVVDDNLGFASDIINIPSRNFFGQSSKSPNGRFTIAWADGGPNRVRRGGYIFLDRGKIVAEGKMARPNDGKVADNGVFILNDWGAMETLNGTFAAFRPDGTLLLSRKFKANLFNNGLSADGRWAACQTANAPSDDGGCLSVFDLSAGKEVGAWQAESGWASFYEFPGDGRTICLGYGDRGTFAYSLTGEFIDRMKWLAVGLQRGDIHIVESLLAETNNQPTRDLTEQLLLAIDAALASLSQTDGKTRARAYRLRGVCFEAIGKPAQALACYETALSLDSKSGVKRKVAQLRQFRQ